MSSFVAPLATARTGVSIVMLTGGSCKQPILMVETTSSAQVTRTQVIATQAAPASTARAVSHGSITMSAELTYYTASQASMQALL